MVYDPDKQIEVECICGKVFNGRQEDVILEYEKCNLSHHGTPQQWNEAYLKMEEKRSEAAKRAHSAEKGQ